MRVLVTRPKADAEALVRRLAEAGVEALVEPMLTIAPVAEAIVALDGVQAILVTSANGARALARTTPRRDVLVYAVGGASAACAEELGFASVVAAGGDVEALADKVIAELDPAAGPLIHAAGSAVAGDLAGRLMKAGFTMRRQMLYEARTPDALSEACTAALSDGALDATLFFSPRTAKTFVTLVRQAGVAEHCARLDAVCLSRAVAVAAGRLSWRRLRVAAAATQEAMIELVTRGL